MRSKARSTKTPYQLLGEAVRERRKALGINQQTAGDLAGCGRLFVSMVEHGKPTVRFDKLVDLLQTLGLQLTLTTGRAGLEVGADVTGN